jgi:hypothetical protein
MGCSASKAVDARPVQVQKPQNAPQGQILIRNTTKDPSDQIVELLRPLQKQSSSKHVNFDKCLETLSEILKNITNNFDNEKFKKIKKKNKRFNKDLGWFSGISELMKFLGFQDQEDYWTYSESLSKSHAQMRVLDLSIAQNKLKTLSQS